MEASIHILLIEDNPGDARLVKEALAEAGQNSYILTWMPDLATGIERLPGHPFDAILLDLGLPDSAGIDTFEKVHTQASQIPIILMTGLDDDALASRVVRHGAQDYIVKGEVTGRMLERVIRYAIERKKAEEQIWHQIERLNALRAIDIAIIASSDLRLTLEILLKQVATNLNVDAASVLLFNQSTQTLEHAASTGFRSPAIRDSSFAYRRRPCRPRHAGAPNDFGPTKKP